MAFFVNCFVDLSFLSSCVLSDIYSFSTVVFNILSIDIDMLQQFLILINTSYEVICIYG